MKSIALTSDRFEGEIILTFHDNTLLVKLEVNATLKDEQHAWFMKRLPREINELGKFLLEHTSFKSIEIPLDVTFEMFWEKYDDKVRSSRKLTERRWNSMKKADQVKAYNYIDRYNRTRGNAEKKYASTYLSHELWNNG